MGRGRDMDEELAAMMAEVNEAFYRENASSFSDTRHAAWPGWERCLADAGVGADEAGRYAVLDVASGNLRFFDFLAREVDVERVDYDAVDSCDELARAGSQAARARVRYQRLDVVGALLGGELERSLDCGEHDLCVCFGFFHHVPTARLRLDLLRALLAKTRPGGTCCVSLWRFMEEPTLAERARATTLEAAAGLGIEEDRLGEGDYLLGWQGKGGAWRYCHSFSNEDAAGLAEGVCDLARLRDDFLSDGRSGELNHYLVFERR